MSITEQEMAEKTEVIKEQLQEHPIVIYMKGTQDFPMCGFSAQAVNVLRTLNKPILSVNVLDDDKLWDALEAYSKWLTVPQVFIKGEFVGGCDIVTEMYENGELKKIGENIEV